MRERVQSLKDINDATERGIALIKRCQQSVVKEEQKQILFCVVQGHIDTQSAQNPGHSF